MSDWAPRRFWTTVDVTEAPGGHTITLDGRPVKTPRKTLLVVPSRALAAELAAEWEAQGERVNPATMPFTRLANSAIDTVTPDFDAVAGMIETYAETDLVCYRAESPAALSERQAAAWDPFLDWAEARFGHRLAVTRGVLPVAQAPAALAALSAAVRGHAPFELTALHELVALSGSLVLGLAAAAGAGRPDDFWQASRIDEEWQIEQWGRDEEAAAATEARRVSFFIAKRFLDLQRDHDEGSRAV